MEVRARELEDSLALAKARAEQFQQALGLIAKVDPSAQVKVMESGLDVQIPSSSSSDRKHSAPALTGGKEVPTLPALIAEVAHLKLKEENSRKRADRLQEMLDKIQVTLFSLVRSFFSVRCSHQHVLF